MVMEMKRTKSAREQRRSVGFVGEMVANSTSLNVPATTTTKGRSRSVSNIWKQASLDAAFGDGSLTDRQQHPQQRELRRASSLSKQRNVLSTQVVDQGSGRPCCGMQCKAFKWDTRRAEWTPIGDMLTNAQGRVLELHPGLTLCKGMYKLRFVTKEYFARHQQQSNNKAFFPYIDVVIEIEDPSEHCHMALLLNHFGYTVFRGH